MLGDSSFGADFIDQILKLIFGQIGKALDPCFFDREIDRPVEGGSVDQREGCRGVMLSGTPINGKWTNGYADVGAAEASVMMVV